MSFVKPKMEGTKMKTRLLASVALVGLLAACAADPGSPESRYELYQKQQEAKQEALEDRVADIPDWFIDVPQSDHAVFSVGSGRSPSLDMALTKATLSAKRQLADRIAGELSEIIREFATEMGSVDNPVVMEELERATQNFVKRVPVHGYRVSNKSIQVDRGSYVAYILLEYGDEEINKVLRRQLERERNATKNENKKKLYDKLDEQLDKRVDSGNNGNDKPVGKGKHKSA